MELPEFEIFCMEPSVDHAMMFGKAMTQAQAPIDEKKELFGEAFECCFYDKVEAVINMWAVGSMLEDDELDESRKIMAVRGFIKDRALTPEIIEEWAWTVWETARADAELLDFLAIDIRNIRGMSRELLVKLEHPSPDHPFRE